MSNSTTDDQPHLSGPPRRSGTFFVIASGAFLLIFLVFILVVSPRLQDSLGLNEGLGFDAPAAGPVVVPLLLDGVEVGQAVWDADGVCAEITDSNGSTFRTCATPDPLRPIWAIDAPDEADPAYLLVASPQAASSITGVTTAGDSLNGLTQARELPAAWTLMALPDDGVVSELIVLNTESSDLGDALCGDPEAPVGGPDRLAGGCLIPQQD